MCFHWQANRLVQLCLTDWAYTYSYNPCPVTLYYSDCFFFWLYWPLDMFWNTLYPFCSPPLWYPSHNTWCIHLQLFSIHYHLFRISISSLPKSCLLTNINLVLSVYNHLESNKPWYSYVILDCFSKGYILFMNVCIVIAGLLFLYLLKLLPNSCGSPSAKNL